MTHFKNLIIEKKQEGCTILAIVTSRKWKWIFVKAKSVRTILILILRKR